MMQATNKSENHLLELAENGTVCGTEQFNILLLFLDKNIRWLTMFLHTKTNVSWYAFLYNFYIDLSMLDPETSNSIQAIH